MAWNDFSKEELRIILTTTHDLCAMHDVEPKCNGYRLVRGDQFFGEFAHISGSKPGGDRRHDENMTEEERESIDNIIILCPNHHTIIDKKDNGYSAEELHEIKRRHINDTSHSSTEITDAAVDDAMSIARATITNFNTNTGNGPQQNSSMSGAAPQINISVAGNYYGLPTPGPAYTAIPLDITQIEQVNYDTQVIRLKEEWLSVPAIRGSQGTNFDSEYYCFRVGEKQFVIASQEFKNYLSGMRADHSMGMLIMNAGQVFDLLLQIRLLTTDGINEHSLIDEIRALSAEKPMRIVIATDDPHALSVPFANLDAETAHCSNPIKLIFSGVAL